MTPDSIPRLLLIAPSRLPSATIYIIKPLEELRRQNRVKFNVLLQSEVTPAWIRASDIVLFCRNIDPESDWILEECLAQRIPTVYDLDDNFWEVPAGLKYSAYHHAPERIRQLERFLSHVDMVRVYSQPLAEKALAYNPNVCQVTPCIDMRLVPAEPLPPRDDRLRITYVTGRGGSDALIDVFAQDLMRLLELYPGMIEMTWWGEVPELFRGHPSTRIVDILHDYDEFLHFLSHQNFDIGLAPLTPTSFNLAKTNTKFRDYGACRIAGIYSDVPVYTSSVVDEQTGLLVSDAPGAWFSSLQRLVVDRALRAGIRERAYRYVYEHYRQELVELQWLDLVADLMHLHPAAHLGADLANSPQRLSEENELFKDEIGRMNARIGEMQIKLKTREREVYARELEAHNYQKELNAQMPRARMLAYALDAQYSRRTNRWIERLVDRRDYAPLLPETFRQLRDDSLLFQENLRGYRLRPSPSFARWPARSYRLRLDRPGLVGISIAPVFDLLPRGGELVLELLFQGETLARAALPAGQIQPDMPLHFTFSPPPAGLPPLVELRILGRDLDVPVRVYEWQHYTLFGLGGLKTRPFIGLEFQEGR